MKKAIIIGVLTLSAVSFANSHKNIDKREGRQHNNYAITQLSEKEQTEFTKVMKERKKENYKSGLELKSKELDMKKLMVEDKVDWGKVEKLNDEISDMKADKRLDGMKFRKEIEDEFGITLGNGRKGHKSGKKGTKNCT